MLKQFNHRCAVCGREKPQVVTIDEESPQDEMNLIPLCPNRHLFDRHNPTQTIETGKIVLLRQYLNPVVLKSQFDPIYRRMQFLHRIEDDTPAAKLSQLSDELINFVVTLEMGVYYGGKLHDLLTQPPENFQIAGRSSVTERIRQAEIQHDQQYREQLRSALPDVEALCVEMLRYQKW